MFTKKSSKNIDLIEIKLIVSNFIFDVIEENSPYMWIAEDEPFINQYSSKISYDHSGKVEKMTYSDLKQMVKDLGKKPVSVCYSSELEELLSEIYINKWTPSYESNRGKNWTSYKEVLEEKFDEWKYENFNLYDEEGNDLNEELEFDLDQILYDFLKDTSIDIYYSKILKLLK